MDGRITRERLVQSAINTHETGKRTLYIILKYGRVDERLTVFFSFFRRIRGVVNRRWSARFASLKPVRRRRRTRVRTKRPRRLVDFRRPWHVGRTVTADTLPKNARANNCDKITDTVLPRSSDKTSENVNKLVVINCE